MYTRMIRTKIKGNSSHRAKDRAESLLSAVLGSRWVPERLDDLRNLECLSNATDWQHAIRFHGLAGILCLHHQTALLELSTDFRAVPELMYKANAKDALINLALTKAVLENFAKNSIAAVPLKGVFLSHQLYGNIARRVSCDIDLMVDPSDFERACRILVGMGYSAKFDILGMGAALKRSILRDIKDISFFREGEPAIELHVRNETAVVNSLPQLKDISLEKITISKGNFFVLPQALMRESIARHALRSNIFRWKWGYDVIECLEQFAGGELALQYTSYNACSRAEHICLNALAKMWGVPTWKRKPHCTSGAIVTYASRAQGRSLSSVEDMGLSKVAYRALQIPAELQSYSGVYRKLRYLSVRTFLWYPENGFRRACIVAKFRPMGFVFNVLKLVRWLTLLGSTKLERTVTNTSKR
jgi:hypothetical protein